MASSASSSSVTPPGDVEPIHVPVGFRFNPNDKEAVEHYLIKKVLGHPFPANIIKEIDVYKYDPDDLPLDITKDLESWAYFFVMKEEEEDGHNIFSTPRGYWKVEASEITTINDGEVIVAFKKSMVYLRGKSPDGFTTCWTMTEYRLNQALTRLKNPTDSNMNHCVLCKVHKRSPNIDQVVEMKNILKKYRRGKNFVQKIAKSTGAE